MCKVSVITICKNSRNEIAKTIKSIASQDFADFEYIIKDGCSDDGTLEVIESYEPLLSNIRHKVVSRNDNGIYSAMNQALELANGDWIIYMNSGDEFYNSSVLRDVFMSKDYSADVLYGHTCCVLRNGGQVIQVNDHNKLTDAVGISQQVCFIKRDVIKKYSFNESYKVLGDFNLLYLLLNNGFRFQGLNQVVARYYRGGVSTQKVRKIKREFDMILGRNPNKGTIKAIIKEIFEKYFVYFSDVLFVLHLCMYNRGKNNEI